jgi:hypothetical protein
MATREAMEQLKATLNGKDSPLYHPPTLRPGIGPPRCPRCSAPLSNDLEASGWTIAPFMRESFAMVVTHVLLWVVGCRNSRKPIFLSRVECRKMIVDT